MVIYSTLQCLYFSDVMELEKKMNWFPPSQSTAVDIRYLVCLCTFLQRSDGRHVFGAQVEEGVCAVGQPDQTLCFVFEHQVCTTKPSRGEEAEALQSQKVNVRSF